jgi:hypothetical protein
VEFGESLKITVARATGPEMVEPILGFRERHRMSRNFLENIGPWAADTLGVREILEETTG